MTPQRYKPMTEDEIRALVQERIKKKSFQPRYSHARWDEMRYLPSDDESFAEKAAFAVALALALKGQKPESLERYRLDWKPGARTNVNERRRWRARWAWAPHGPCMITRLNDKGKEIRLGPDLSKYLFEDEPPHLIAPPEPTQMIMPPEGDTYAFDWYLEQATKELAELREMRRAMKKRTLLTDRYATWVCKDRQWRGHTLAIPRDFVDLDRVIVFEGEDEYVQFAADPFLRAHVILEQDGVKICFTGHPDEGPIPVDQYEPLARFPKGKPRKTPEELQKTFDLRPTILVRRQNFIDLRKEWRKKKWWEDERKGYDTPLELGPPAGDIREVVARTHPEWWVNWEWRIAGIKGAINEPARKHPKVPLAIKKKLNRRHYLNGLYTLTEKHLRAYYRHSGARNPVPVVDFRRIEIPIMRFGTSEELIPADATIVPYEPQRNEASKSWHEAMEKLSADQQREALSEGRRVHQLQKARRAQRAALTELCGYISSTTSRQHGRSEGLSNTGRALARWTGESFVDRLAAEVPGAVYLAYFDGRPQDVDRDDYRAAAIKKYNRAVKTGRGWSGLDSHIERLAQNAKSWIVHDNTSDNDILGGDALEWANDPEWSEEKEIEGAAEDVAKVASSALNLDTGSDPDDDPGESEYDSYQLEPEDFDTYHFRESAQKSIEQRKAIEGFRKWGRRGSSAEKYKAIPAKGTLSDMWRQRLYPTYRDATLLDLADVRRMPTLDDKPPVTYIRTGEAPVREVVERGGVPVELEPFTILAYPTYDDLRCEFRGRNGTCFGLTENQREAFLFYLDGRKHKDIAAEIKRSEDTVEDRISGGWRKIEKVLGTPVSRAVLRKKQDRREFTWEDMEGKRRKKKKIPDQTYPQEDSHTDDR